jgi:hypothetical protein
MFPCRNLYLPPYLDFRKKKRAFVPHDSSTEISSVQSSGCVDAVHPDSAIHHPWFFRCRTSNRYCFFFYIRTRYSRGLDWILDDWSGRRFRCIHPEQVRPAKQRKECLIMEGVSEKVDPADSPSTVRPFKSLQQYQNHKDMGRFNTGDIHLAKDCAFAFSSSQNSERPRNHHRRRTRLSVGAFTFFCQIQPIHNTLLLPSPRLRLVFPPIKSHNIYYPF